jgi:mono/diheme cytochrome c family protein
MGGAVSFRRSGVMLTLLLAGVLVSGAFVASARPTSPSTAKPAALPGDPVAGLETFRAFCAGCHNLKAAGLQGKNKPGSDLDQRKPSFTKIVTLIVQGGGGGAPSKRLLAQLSYDQIYDVATFVALYAGKPGPVRGATVAPPTPIDLKAPLLSASAATGAKPSGLFTATLSGRALRWHIAVRGSAGETPTGRIQLRTASGGKPVGPITIDCGTCASPGNGFIVVSATQASALTKGGGVLVVQAPGAASGALRGKIAVIPY